MSGQFDTESGGTVGIYRRGHRYNLVVKEGDEIAPSVVELTEDELYRLIYMASKDLRWLVNYASWIAVDSEFEDVSDPVRNDLRIIGIGDRIPTEAEITKRRRAAQRRAKG